MSYLAMNRRDSAVQVPIREANTTTTTPGRLGEIAHGSRDDNVLRAVALNPNTPVTALWHLAARFPREVLSNPVLPLLSLENPDLGLAIPPLAALRFLCVDDLPSWMINGIAHSPPVNASLVKEAVRTHYQLAGEAEVGWQAVVQDEFTALAQAQATTFYGRNAPQQSSTLAALKRVLRWRLAPRWLLAPLLAECLKSEAFSAGVAFLPDGAAEQALSESQTQSLHLGAFARPEPPTNTDERLAHYTAHALHALVRAERQKHDSAPATKYRTSYYEARQPNASPTLLRALVAHKKRRVRSAVARNPVTPLDALERLAVDEDSYVRGALARNPRLPQVLLKQLAGDPHCVVRANIARHPLTPPSVQELLAYDADGEVLDALFYRGDLAPGLAEQVAQRRGAVTIWGRERPTRQKARDSQTPSFEVGTLMEPEFEVVEGKRNVGGRAVDLAPHFRLLCRLANHPHVPAALLERLAAMANSSLRAVAASSPAAPPALLRALAEDPHFHVRSKALYNPRVPSECALRFVEEEANSSWSNWMSIVANSALPLPALEIISTLR